MPDTITIPSFGETIAAQLQFSHFATKANLADITDEDSRTLPQPAGNSINWLLGHMITVRQSLLSKLGGEALLSTESTKAYGRGTTASADLPETLPSLVAAYERSQQQLDAILVRLSDEQLAGPAPFHPLGAARPEASLATLLQKSAMHDAYHAGQIGIVRRVIGKPGVIG